LAAARDGCRISRYDCGSAGVHIRFRDFPRTELPMVPAQEAGLQTVMKIAGGWPLPFSHRDCASLCSCSWKLHDFFVPCLYFFCLLRRWRLGVDALPLALTPLGHARNRKEQERSRGVLLCGPEAKRTLREVSCPLSPQLLVTSSPSHQDIRYPTLTLTLSGSRTRRSQH
jgi:hypothetical protein